MNSFLFLRKGYSPPPGNRTLLSVKNKKQDIKLIFRWNDKFGRNHNLETLKAFNNIKQRELFSYIYQFRRNLTAGSEHTAEVTYIKQSKQDILWSLYKLILPILFPAKANFTDSLEFTNKNSKEWGKYFRRLKRYDVRKRMTLFTVN